MTIKRFTFQSWLLDEWVDFQDSFDKMLCQKERISLEAAMEIGRVQPIGRRHDGLCDAYNTARLLAKVQRQTALQLEFVPITSYYEQIESLSYSMEELITPELLAQIDSLEAEPELEEEMTCTQEEDWSLFRKGCGFIWGQEAVADENWHKILFRLEMRRLDMIDYLKALFVKDKLLEEN